ncbi:MAG: hypothetical protein R3F11_11345 [Verrucomicrobiales bacterium]
MKFSKFVFAAAFALPFYLCGILPCPAIRFGDNGIIAFFAPGKLGGWGSSGLWHEGQDQPFAWSIVARDSSGALRAIDTENGRLMRDRRLQGNVSGFQSLAPIPWSRVKVDSRKAFFLADRAAKSAGAGFNSLTYTLRCADGTSDPIWIVSVQDREGQDVGTMMIAADSEKILHQSWYSQGDYRPGSNTQPNHPANQGYGNSTASGGDDSPTEQVTEGVKDGAGQVKDAAKEGWRRTKNAFKGLISGWKKGD